MIYYLISLCCIYLLTRTAFQIMVRNIKSVPEDERCGETVKKTNLACAMRKQEKYGDRCYHHRVNKEKKEVDDDNRCKAIKKSDNLRCNSKRKDGDFCGRHQSKNVNVNEESSKKEKSWLINSFKNHSKNSKRVGEVINFVKKNGGLDYAVCKMKSFQKEALNLLAPFPDSIYKKSLILMVNYVIERNK